MRLKVGFYLVECADDGAQEKTIVPMQQVFMDLDDEARRVLPRLEAMQSAYDDAFGVTKSQLDQAKLDWVKARSAVKPFFDAAGETIGVFLLVKAAQHYAEPEPAVETMGADG